MKLSIGNCAITTSGIRGHVHIIEMNGEWALVFGIHKCGHIKASVPGPLSRLVIMSIVDLEDGSSKINKNQNS
jgi:hypothetical protein